MKKSLSIILSLLMIISTLTALPFTAHALEPSGKCGEDVTYTFDSSTGTLTISGTGDMYELGELVELGYNLDSPFEFNNDIRNIVINSGVTNIGDSAFEWCTSLTSITIPNSVTSIGRYAFDDCTSLKSITIPDSVISIGDSAFSGCANLKSITIPNSVTSIGDEAFSCCSSLTSVVVDSNNKYYDSRNNCNAIIETSTNTLIAGCKNTVIPNSVTSIGDSAFYDCTNLTSITIPNSVTSIGEDAFFDCTNLTSITIPNSVASIGNHAFYDCANLTSITIPNSITSIGDDAFGWCTSLTSITIPDSVISIGDSAFSNCANLTSITIPNSVASIGNYAFYDCANLTSITIPNSVTSIGESAFSGCTSLTSIVVDSNNKYYDSRNNCNAIIETSTNKLITGCENTVIPNSVTSIDNGAFEWCTSLTKITIPDSVTSIGDKAFSNCLNLTDVYYKGTKTQWNAIRKYSNNESLTKATIHCTDGIINCRHVSIKSSVTKKPTYTATGVKTYKCTVCGKVLKTETIAKLPKKANTLVASGKTATVKFANLKKKNQTVLQKNAFAISKAQGKVTYKKASGNGKITVNSAGKFTVKKGLKKGTYKIKVKVTAAGNTTYKAVTKTVTVTIKVK